MEIQRWISAGTSVDDSEWVVFDQDGLTYLGAHPYEFDSGIEPEHGFIRWFLLYSKYDRD